MFSDRAAHICAPPSLSAALLFYKTLCWYICCTCQKKLLLFYICTYSTSKLLGMLPTQSNFVLSSVHQSSVHQYSLPLCKCCEEKQADTHLSLHIYVCMSIVHCSLCPKRSRQIHTCAFTYVCVHCSIIVSSSIVHCVHQQGKSEQFIAMPCYTFTKMRMYKYTNTNIQIYILCPAARQG